MALYYLCLSYYLSSVFYIVRYVVSTEYRVAVKSLARPERKQATATEDFDFHTSYL